MLRLTLFFPDENKISQLSFDAFLQQYNLSIHKTDGKRLLRWMRHIRDHQGKWDMDDIETLE